MQCASRNPRAPTPPSSRDPSHAKIDSPHFSYHLLPPLSSHHQTILFNPLPSRLDGTPRAPCRALRLFLSPFFSPLPFLTPSHFHYEIVIRLSVTLFTSIVSFPLGLVFGSSRHHFYLARLSTVSGLPPPYSIHSELP